jgi:hypothetical protein
MALDTKLQERIEGLAEELRRELYGPRGGIRPGERSS